MKTPTLWWCCCWAGLLALPTLVSAETETIVCFRHGERTKAELGQLTVQGLNRALALPAVLSAHFGTPQFLFAPDPARNLISDGKPGSGHYDYVRPLATIEPTAVKFGLPVSTNFGYHEIDKLEAELLLPQYHNALVFVAWEHAWEARFVTKIVADLGGAPNQVPPWASSDFDSFYIVRIERSGGKTTVSFSLDHEGLDGMSDQFPTPPKP